MNPVVEATGEDLGESVLLSQYNDLLRQPSTVGDEEGRLLWSVFEDAIRSYLANRERSNPAQRKRFEQIRSWFATGGEPRSLLAYQSLSVLLGVDAGRLLKGLKSLSMPVSFRADASVPDPKVRRHEGSESERAAGTPPRTRVAKRQIKDLEQP